MERGSGTYANRLSLRPAVVEDSRLQGTSDGLVTSCLFKERVVATRRRREEQAEVGVGGGDTGKARTGHGRGRRLGGNAGKERTGCCRRDGGTEGVRTYNWGGGSRSSFHLERRGSNWESSSEEKREDGNHLVTLP